MILNNKDFILISDNYTGANDKNLYFYCNKCKETWDMSWGEIIRGYGCPYCVHRRAGNNNNLKVEFPEIAIDWDYEKNFPVCPDQIVSGCEKRYFWKCHRCSHSWFTTPNSRTTERKNGRGTGCPGCSGRVATSINNLFLKCPELMLEWDWNKNEDISPYELTPYAKRKVYWICKNNHSWIAAPCARNSAKNRVGTRCPHCLMTTGEIFVQKALLKFKICYEYQKKLLNCKNKKSLFFDFYLNDFDCCIEYQGIQHYEPVDFANRGIDWATKLFEGNQQKDMIKRKYCEENNIKLIEIPYWKLNNIEKILEEALNLQVGKEV